MDFYIKLAKPEDDKELEGIVLFEDLGEPLVLGVGKTEYRYFSKDYGYFDYVEEIDDIFYEISSILPDARLCYQSAQHPLSGGIDTMLKKENDDNVYYCSEWGLGCYMDLKGEYDEDDMEWDCIGTDAWCDFVIELSENED